MSFVLVCESTTFASIDASDAAVIKETVGVCRLGNDLENDYEPFR